MILDRYRSIPTPPFTSACILQHPYQEKPFFLEVDASNPGIRAVLSQRHSEPSKMYPCAFFSRKLNSAEQNYHMGNREVLTMKAAFEQQRHWLEGTNHPFLELTDHRNLKYLRSVKELNQRQARWILPSISLLVMFQEQRQTLYQGNSKQWQTHSAFHYDSCAFSVEPHTGTKSNQWVPSTSSRVPSWSNLHASEI